MAALAKEPGDKYDAVTLARTVAGMLQFQEDVLGANVSTNVITVIASVP